MQFLRTLVVATVISTGQKLTIVVVVVIVVVIGLLIAYNYTVML